MRIPSLLLALAILAGCPRRAPTAEPPPPTDELIEAYVASAFTYCDAIALSQRWELPLYDTKLRIGEKLLAGEHKVMATERGTAFFDARRNGTKICTLEDVLAPEDADSLARLWGISRQRVYTTVDNKLAGGLEAYVMQEAELARTKFGGESRLDDKLDSAWSASGYSYCDAQLLAAAWEMQDKTYEAKLTAADKLLRGDASAVDMALRTARTGDYDVQCEWYHLTLDYSDAEAMAAHWGTDISEAKARIARAYTRPNWEETRTLIDRVNTR